MQVLIACKSLSNRRNGELVASLARAFQGAGHSVCISTVYAEESALKLRQDGFEVDEGFVTLHERNFDLIQVFDSPSAILARHYFPVVPIVLVVNPNQSGDAFSPSIDVGISRFIFQSDDQRESCIDQFGIDPGKTSVLSNMDGEGFKRFVEQILEHASTATDDRGIMPVPANEILFYLDIFKTHSKLADTVTELQAEHGRIRLELDNLKPKLTALREGYNREMGSLRSQRISRGIGSMPTLTADSQPRETELPERKYYRGENLVFILGPPRSGTTWMLSLLKEHPDVVAATVDNLGMRINDAQTLETGIFLEDRGLSENQIRDRFYDLSTAHPGKVIVEKTPIHTFYAERIRGIFPLAVLLLVQRDGRDVVTSMLKVARDRNAWWKGAPGETADAAALWLHYAVAALACERQNATLTIRYEDLSSDPAGELKRILSALAMSTLHAAHQVEASRTGRNIPIKGVYRKGKTGSWREQFTARDVDVFKSIAGSMLILQGYEEDNSWRL